VLVLDSGQVIFDGPVHDGIAKYSVTASAAVSADLTNHSDRGGLGQYARFKSIALFNAAGQPCDTFSMGDTVNVEMELVCGRPLDSAEIGIGVMNSLGAYIHNFVSNWEGLRTRLDVGTHRFRVAIPKLSVYPGTYSLTAWVCRQGSQRVDDQVDNAIAFIVMESNLTGHNPYFERYRLSKCEVYWPSTWSHSSSLER
jgi:hypothetical protein